MKGGKDFRAIWWGKNEPQTKSIVRVCSFWTGHHKLLFFFLVEQNRVVKGRQWNDACNTWPLVGTNSCWNRSPEPELVGLTPRHSDNREDVADSLLLVGCGFESRPGAFRRRVCMFSLRLAWSFLGSSFLQFENMHVR